MVRNMVHHALSRVGFVVLSAADGAEALTLSRAYDGTIDLLLTDVSMPHVTGTELADTLREERPGISILLMTGHSSGQVPPRLQPGMLRKPFLPGELMKRIQQALDGGK